MLNFSMCDKMGALCYEYTVGLIISAKTFIRTVIPRITYFRAYVAPDPISQDAQILKYDAEDIFDLLNSNDREITLENVFAIRN
jgi:hypothetical protein